MSDFLGKKGFNRTTKIHNSGSMDRLYRPLYIGAISIYRLVVRVIALFNYKVALGVKGRQHWQSKLRAGLVNRKSGQLSYWFHCASLGEFELALPVIQEVRRRSGEEAYIVVSFFSPSGYEARNNHPDIDLCTYLPTDTASNALEIFDLVMPHCIILVKYEFWYFMLREARKRVVSVHVIGARFRSQMIYFTHLKGFYKSLFRWIDGWFVQDRPSMELLQSFGIQYVKFYGDTRIDRTKSIADQQYTFDAILKWKNNMPVFIMGSVWERDLEVLEPVLTEISKTHKILIAPHEMTESFLVHIESIFPGEALRYSHHQNVTNPEINKILIIDHVGDLAKMYRYGEVAYVGGAFGSGLHNIYEPLAHGIPVIFGPKVNHFPEASEVIIAEVGRSIKTTEDFMVTWKYFQEQNSEEMKDRIDAFLRPSIGASKKIVADIFSTTRILE